MANAANANAYAFTNVEPMYVRLKRKSETYFIQCMNSKFIFILIWSNNLLNFFIFSLKASTVEELREELSNMNNQPVGLMLLTYLIFRSDWINRPRTYEYIKKCQKFKSLLSSRCYPCQILTLIQIQERKAGFEKEINAQLEIQKKKRRKNADTSEEDVC